MLRMNLIHHFSDVVMQGLLRLQNQGALAVLVVLSLAGCADRVPSEFSILNG